MTLKKAPITENNASISDQDLWKMLSQDDPDHQVADAWVDADDPMALAQALDALEQQNVDLEPTTHDGISSAGQVASAAADLWAGKIEAKALAGSPTLVALKNRADRLVQTAQRASDRLGLKGWLITLTTATSLSIAGFSTVQALAPYEPTSGTINAPYTLTEGSLFGSSDSLWALEESASSNGGGQ